MSDLTESERKLIELLRECEIERVNASWSGADLTISRPFRQRIESRPITGHDIAEAFYAAMERRV